MTGGEWSSLMLPFRGEDRKGQRPFWKGKGACGVALGSRVEGRQTTGVGQRLD
jgi:hypothetical protein